MIALKRANWIEVKIEVGIHHAAERCGGAVEDDR